MSEHKVINLHSPTCPINVKINLPSSKSISNRLLMLKALSGIEFPIFNLSKASDTLMLENALQHINCKRNDDKRVTIDIADAGTSMRFLVAFLSITSGKWLLTGSERMRERVVGPLVNALRMLGAQIEYAAAEGFPPLLIKGARLVGKEVSIDAHISSQFISALMLVAPLLPFGLTIRLLGKASSAPYIFMTAKLMEQAEVKIIQSEDFIHIEHQQYNPGLFTVEPDWSAAAFWFEIAAFASEPSIGLRGLNDSGLQGDSQVADIFTRLGVKTEFKDEGAVLTKSSTPAVDHFLYDFISCPDLALPVAVTCAGLKIDATLIGLKSLRIKESDRFQALFCELSALGYEVNELSGDILRILPGKNIDLSEKHHIVETYNDHRMAMSFAPLALLHQNIKISNPDVVKKSYPGYWEDLTEAGILLK